MLVSMDLTKKETGMKKTVCDRCGAEFVGRNASGYHDIIINGNTYVDLCEDCHEE